MNVLEFIYQENAIHFLVNPNDKNVMVNATEMAKIFDKKTEYFLKSDHAKAFIEILKRVSYSPQINDKEASDSEEINDNLLPFGRRIIDNRGRNGVYFNRVLALKFAAWLDPEFEVWVFSKIEEITFGNYKKHWEAHAKQEEAKALMEDIKAEILTHPSPESVARYFEAEAIVKNAKAAKINAIRNQLKLFNIT